MTYCLQVAILCNHQRAVTKGHAGQMERLSERMHKLNEELLELQHELKAAEKGKAYGDKKRRDPERCALTGLVRLCCGMEMYIDSVRLDQSLRVNQGQSFCFENAIKAVGPLALSCCALPALWALLLVTPVHTACDCRMKDIVSDSKTRMLCRVHAAIDAKKAVIAKAEINASVKDDLKTVALGTSKINYLDPRITVAWCKRNEVPMEKIFNKTLITKFFWAMDVAPDFKF